MRNLCCCVVGVPWDPSCSRNGSRLAQPRLIGEIHQLPEPAPLVGYMALNTPQPACSPTRHQSTTKYPTGGGIQARCFTLLFYIRNATVWCSRLVYLHKLDKEKDKKKIPIRLLAMVHDYYDVVVPHIFC
ncbi:unnamed protein product [Ectocarpus sp. 12 AP-2014]